MLFIIVVLGAQRTKMQKMKRKTFSLNEIESTLHTLTECHLKKKKNYKRNYKENPKC